MIYAVIDTNVIVASFLTKHSDSATAQVMYAMGIGLITPLYNNEILDEYREVLSRKKFHFPITYIENVIEYTITHGIAMERLHYEGSLPDESDRVFYEVSLSKEDSFLVTGNLKHYPISPKVVTPRDFLETCLSNQL